MTRSAVAAGPGPAEAAPELPAEATTEHPVEAAADHSADAAGDHPDSTAEREIPLRRNLKFQMLWAGQVASSLGVNVANVAYPLAILGLTGSPARAGLFAAVLTTGMLIGALPGGQLADRYDRRMVVIVAESVRAAVTVAVAAGFILGGLSLAELLAAAVVLGAGQAVSGAARLPLVRSVVPASQLTSALVQDEVRQNGAALAGPSLAGVLYAVRALAHAIPFLFTAVMFVLSMLAAVAMKALPGGSQPAGTARTAESASAAAETDEMTAGTGKKASASMLTGLRALWQSPLLRAAMLLIMMVNTVGAALDLVIIVILRGEHVRPGLIGVVLAAAAVGGLAGAPLVKPLHKLRPGILLLTFCLLDVPFLAGMALPFGPWWVASLLFLESFAVPALRVLVDVLIFRQTPDGQRGRVVAAVMTLIGVGMPVGMAGAGLLLQWLAPQTVVLILTAALAAGVGYCATKRELWQARWPR
jgi:MFS family permease